MLLLLLFLFLFLLLGCFFIFCWRYKCRNKEIKEWMNECMNDWLNEWASKRRRSEQQTTWVSMCVSEYVFKMQACLHRNMTISWGNEKISQTLTVTPANKQTNKYNETFNQPTVERKKGIWNENWIEETGICCWLLKKLFIKMTNWNNVVK